MNQLSNERVTALAREFSRCLRATLDAQEMKEVLDRNAAQDNPGVCHSHDFCDANMVMQTAAKNLGYAENFDTADTEDQIDDCCSLWNAAWNEAKSTGFLADLV